MESLTPIPELENSLGHKRTFSEGPWHVRFWGDSVAKVIDLTVVLRW